MRRRAKICFVIYIAGFFFKKKFCYEVIAKQKFYKRSSNHYLGGLVRTQYVYIRTYIHTYIRTYIYIYNFIYKSIYISI